MTMKWIRRVAFGGAAVYLLYVAADAIRQAGWTSQALFPALAGVLFGVMAVFGKGG
jgi:hypothetical protein